MSTQMPLARRILIGNSFVEPPGVNTEGTPFDPTIAVQAIKDGEAQLFDINIARDLLRNGGGIREKAEPIKPPYPMTWVEWQYEDSLSRWTQCACLIVDTSYSEADINTDLKDKLLFLFYVSLNDGPKWLNTAAGYVATLTDAGQLSDCPNIFMASETTPPRKLVSGYEEFMYHQLCLVLLALSLMNCKNVTVEATGSINIKRSSREKRRGMPAKRVDYHIIQLPGNGTQSDGKGGHRATALHRVRGHFKTFTPERPLMGQHVGTYWWGWQVRGNPENGVVVSDYKLKQPGAGVITGATQ